LAIFSRLIGYPLIAVLVILVLTICSKVFDWDTDSILNLGAISYLLWIPMGEITALIIRDKLRNVFKKFFNAILKRIKGNDYEI